MPSGSARTIRATFSPIIALTLAFMAGVLLTHYLALPGTIILLVAVFCVGGAIWGLTRNRRRLSIFSVLALWLTLGGLSYHVRYQRCPVDDIVHYSWPKPMLVRVRAQVVQNSHWAESKSPWPADPSQYFSVEVSQIQTTKGWVRGSGLLQVRVKRPFRTRTRGQRLEMLGMLSRYRGPRNPGEFDWQQHQRFEGKLSRLTVENGAVMRRLPSAKSSKGFFARLSEGFSSVLTDEEFSPETNSLLKAMVLGERDLAFRRLNEAFQKTGLFHFLCVSGLHLGILAGFIWFIGQIIGLGRRTNAALVMAAVIFYALLVPARAPIMRACIVVSLLCLAEITGRWTHKLHTLALAALLVLLWRPAEIFNIGFQLSFIIVAALLILCPRLTRLLLGEQVVRWTTNPGIHPRAQVRQFGLWLWAWLIRLFSTCLIAWFVAAPLILYYFGWFNPWAPFYSVIVAPLAVATVVSGYITAVVGTLFPLLAEALRSVSLSFADAFYNTAVVLSKIPGIIQHLPAPPAPLMAAFYIWLILLAVRPRLRLRYNTSFLSRAWMIPPFLAFLVVYFWSSGPVKPNETLALHLLDVGNGQVCIVELPNGPSLAFDAGSMNIPDLSSRTIMPFLRSRHLRRLDGLVISHPNWDHYSSAADLITQAQVPVIIISPYFTSDADRKGLFELFNSNAGTATVSSGERLWDSGDARTEVLWPPANPNQAPNLEPNDSSLVVCLSYAGRRILLPGDISLAAQRLLLANGTDLQADVLVWPHHGAMVRTTAQFFQAVNPTILLVSCDRIRAQRIRQADNSALLGQRPCYSTAENGTLTLLLDRKGLKVQPFIKAD